MDHKSKIILIAGPTASGKSNFALKIAKKIKGEVINADSMQVYKELQVLTVRPTKKDQKKIKHHLYGFQNVKKKFSTGHWLKLANKKIIEIKKRKKVPILVGGTGLYFKALTDGLVKIPEIPKNIRIKTRTLHNRIGQKKFFDQLIKLDPLAKDFVIPSDAQRSMRVYEVKKFTNISLFNLIKNTKSNFNNDVFKKIFINISKDLLEKKIKNRIEDMFKEGAIEEVRSFYKMRVYKELSSNKIIGLSLDIFMKL